MQAEVSNEIQSSKFRTSSTILVVSNELHVLRREAEAPDCARYALGWPISMRRPRIIMITITMTLMIWMLMMMTSVFDISCMQYVIRGG